MTSARSCGDVPFHYVRNIYLDTWIPCLWVWRAMCLVFQQEVVAVNSSDDACWRRVAVCSCTHFFRHEWDCKVSWFYYNIIKTGHLNLQGIAMVSVVEVEVKLAFHCVGWGVLCSYYDVTHLLFLWYDLVLKDFRRAGVTWETSYIHWHMLHCIVSTVIAGHQKLLDLLRFTIICEPTSLI